MDLKQYKSQIKDQLLGDVRKQVRKDSLIRAGQINTPSTIPSCYGENYTPHDHISQLLAHHKLRNDYDILLRKMNKMKGPSIDMTGHADAGYSGGNCASDSDTDEETGGKIHFTKSLKSFGKSVGKTIGNTVGDIAKQGVNELKQEGMNQLKDYGRQMLTEGEETGGKIHFAKSMKKFGKSLGNTVGNIAKQGVNELKQEGINQLKDYGRQMLTEAPEMLETEAPMLLAAGIKQKRTRKVSQKESNRHALIRQLMSKHKCSLAEASKHIKQNNLKY
jgi:hypothetical protein